jgi:hypothetical protein
MKKRFLKGYICTIAEKNMTGHLKMTIDMLKNARNVQRKVLSLD